MPEDFVPTREQVEAALADPDQTEDELSVLTAEERTAAAAFLPRLVAKIRARSEADAAKKLADQTNELIAQNNRMMTEEVAKLRAQLQPPDPAQLETLLSQEYGQMQVSVFGRKAATEKTFTLRELPQAVERKVIGIVTKTIVPHLKELAAVEWAASASNAEKLQKILDMLPNGMDMLAECCALCLDPFGDEGITTEWVQANMSSSRIMNVIEAQFTISRLRDFGSAVSRLIPR